MSYMMRRKQTQEKTKNEMSQTLGGLDTFGLFNSIDVDNVNSLSFGGIGTGATTIPLVSVFFDLLNIFLPMPLIVF